MQTTHDFATPEIVQYSLNAVTLQIAIPFSQTLLFNVTMPNESTFTLAWGSAINPDGLEWHADYWDSSVIDTSS